MPSISILEILTYMRKHIKAIIVCILACCVIGQGVVKYKQQYTASMVIKYTYDQAAEGLNPKGEALDVYEITSPVVIESVISELGLNTSVEKLRNGVTIEPFVDAATKQKQQALTEKGEDFEYFPVQYTIKFSYSGSNDYEYGKVFLNKLLTSYDDYFRQTYTRQRKIQDAFSNLDYENYDYMEICELIEGQYNSIIKILSDLSEQDSAFRSPKTGLTFSDLITLYNNMYSTDYQKLYSNVRIGLLSKNSELLIKKFQHNIEQLNLTYQKKTHAADVSYRVMEDFYRKYKEGLINNELGLEPGSNDSRENVIQEETDLIITTYDQIITQYVDVSVEATDAKNLMQYYTDLMYAYQNDTVSPEAKQVYQKNAENLILRIDGQMKSYINLTNDTLSDYNRYRGAKYISFLTPVEVKSLLAPRTVLIFSIIAGLFLGILLAIAIEWIKSVKYKADTQLRIERIESLKGGIIPIDTSELSEVEKMLFEEAANDFPSFRMYYQPIVDNTRKFVGAEALVRWENSDLGMIMPDEFLDLAEKHDIMAILGEWIFKTVCRQCREWNEITPDMWISVNFTVNQINALKFMDSIRSAIENSGVNVNNVVFELSGGGKIEDTEAISKKLAEIKALGLRVSIDNFGNENSSIDTLYGLPIDIIKIDKSITAGVCSKLSDMNFVSSVVNMATLFKYKVCAEGIESEEQFKKMVSIGVDYLQGYYFAKPMPADKFEMVLTNYK